MNEKLCFVQLLHPGGEHGMDEAGVRALEPQEPTEAFEAGAA